ncbi:winged helix-turn-helix domain-containing protein [Pseudomarimonas arenosa]|uniref:Winged helix-turn-helix domain-containing protein n=1 Tax=Pseudomarimonas arenosa TaxID=2774145 RepID=A0AAW3ZLK2_9GAMM|nr:winged helix-turn-helix domain-containing protein [Pseudomarimonas arenosa]MBD8526843.1 winged helix-turn-helix domain-containing protein [Pseudomarimonas arenosa]
MDQRSALNTAPANGRIRLLPDECSGAHPIIEFDFGTLQFDNGHKLSPKACQVLWQLLQHAGETIGKEQLLDSVWSGQPRVPDVLVQAITEIRRGLGEELRAGLRTIPKHGYRLELQVSWLDGKAPSNSSDDADSRPPRHRASSVTLTLLSLLAVALASWWVVRQETSTAPPDGQLRVGARLSFEPGPDRQAALSPDGRLLAYVRPLAPGGVWKVHLRQPGLATPPQLLSSADTALELQPAWSNRGDRLAWLRIDDQGCRFVIHRLADGQQQQVGDCFRDIAPPFAWSPDDRALLVTDRMESTQRALHLVLLDLLSGERRLLDYPRAEAQADYQPRLSPDRGHWAFLRSARQATELWVMAVDGSQARQVTRFASGLAGFDWLADGRGWLVVAAGTARPSWWQVDLSGSRHPIDGPHLVQPSRAADADLWVAEQPASASVLWRGVGDQARPLAPSEQGSDQFPTPHPSGGLLFVSNRRGPAELWWLPVLDAPAQPLSSPADAFGRPLWWDQDSFLLSVREGSQWQLQRRWLHRPQTNTIDLAPYQVSELARVDQHWFAIGSRIDNPGHSELLRLRLVDGEIQRAEPTGIAAIAVRSGEGQLWIRQYLQRGVRQLDVQTLALGAAVGEDSHFLDWRIEDGGLLYWRRSDLQRHELVWLDPQGQRPSRLELPADEVFNPFAGLARTAQGELLSVRHNADAGDLHALEWLEAGR